jgi:hypothetical protein
VARLDFGKAVEVDGREERVGGVDIAHAGVGTRGVVEIGPIVPLFTN